MTSMFRGWEYATSGDYHQELDMNWSYAPTYLRKLALVRKMLLSIGPEARIVDVGCGEGVLVNEFSARGFAIEGLDPNYESDRVRRGSVLDMPYPSGSVDAVLLLDVFEHLAFCDQPRALLEIQRVLRPQGVLIASIPNLAHWNSRIRMLVFGCLDRSDTETNHVGERPFAENRQLLRQAGFRITDVGGITLTVPFVYRRVICRWPSRFRWLHDFLEPLAVPRLALLNVFVCRKNGTDVG